MELKGEYQIPATQEDVWDALNNPDILKQSIPGCESLEKLSDTQFQATVMAKVGPVKAKFKGKVDLSELNPPHSYVITGQGQGGPAGFAKGQAAVALQEVPGGTLLSYTVSATVGGKLAQIGQRLIDGTAKKMADDFFKSFGETVGKAQTLPAEAPKIETKVVPTAASPLAGSVAKGLTAGALIALVLIAVWLL